MDLRPRDWGFWSLFAQLSKQIYWHHVSGRGYKLLTQNCERKRRIWRFRHRSGEVGSESHIDSHIFERGRLWLQRVWLKEKRQCDNDLGFFVFSLWFHHLSVVVRYSFWRCSFDYERSIIQSKIWASTFQIRRPWILRSL